MYTHKEKVIALKRRMLDVAYKSKRGFLPSSFSIMDILVSLYYEIMGENDVFVLSKGHAAFGLYAVLEDRGVLDWNELYQLGNYNSRLPLMAERGTPGILFSTGSLGHGLAEAMGYSYGRQLQGETGKTYVLIGDGELNEGSNWEVIQSALRRKIKNFYCIIDNNLSSNPAVIYDDYKKIIEGLGWNYVRIDGHDEWELRECLKKEYTLPTVIVADTIKGLGCKTMEQEPTLWHSKAPTKEEYDILVKELQG